MAGQQFPSINIPIFHLKVLFKGEDYIFAQRIVRVLSPVFLTENLHLFFCGHFWPWKKETASLKAFWASFG